MTVPAGTPRLFGRGTVSGDAAWSLAYTGVVRVATLGISVAVARGIGSAGAGALGVALQVIALGSMLAAFSLPLGVAKHLAESEDPARRTALLRASGGLVLGLSGVVAAGLLVLAGWLARDVYHDPSLSSVLTWCGPMVLATAATLWVEGALQGLRRFETLARWGVAVAVVDLAVGVLASLWGVAAVLAGRAAVRGGAVLVAVARWLPVRGARPLREDARAPVTPAPGATLAPLLGFAGPALMGSIVVLAGQTVLRLMLVRSSGLEAAGHFQAADGLAQGLLLIPGAASAAFLRSVSSDRAAGFAALRTTFPRALSQVIAWNLPVCLLLVGLSPWLVPWIFGSEFVPARPVLVLLAVAYGLAGPSALFGAVLFGRGEVWRGVALNTLWVIGTLAAFQFVTARLGATGAAIALAAAYLGHVILCLLALAPTWPVRVTGLVPPLVVTALCLGVAAALTLTRAVPAWSAAAACVLMGALVFGALALRPLLKSRAKDAT